MTTTSPVVIPGGDRILALRVLPEQATAGGILIPETYQRRPQMALFICAGHGGPKTGSYDIGRTLKPGDTLGYGDHSGVQLEFDGREYVLLAPTEILYVIPCGDVDDDDEGQGDGDPWAHTVRTDTAHAEIRTQDSDLTITIETSDKGTEQTLSEAIKDVVRAIVKDNLPDEADEADDNT